MTASAHILTYGVPTDLGTAKHLQSDGLQANVDLVKKLDAAKTMRDVEWHKELCIELTANRAALALLAATFGPPTAQQLQSLQDTADNEDRCNQPRQPRYNQRRR